MRILVIGDSCIDIFRYGKVDRLAPEAPIPIIVPEKETPNPGMAGNVVANLQALGINTHFVCNTENVVKTRYVDDRSGQILLRVDKNDKVKRISKLYLHDIESNLYYGNKIDAIKTVYE